MPKTTDAERAKRERRARTDPPLENLTPIKPQRVGKEARLAYLAKKKVQRWIERNAKGLRVVDIRRFARPDEYIEWSEAYYVERGADGKLVLKCRIVCGDPAPK